MEHAHINLAAVILTSNTHIKDGKIQVLNVGHINSLTLRSLNGILLLDD